MLDLNNNLISFTLEPEEKARIEAIHQGFGQSEIMYLMRRRDRTEKKYPKNALGDVATDLKVKLLSNDGTSVINGESGELCVKAIGKNILFNGYFNNPKMTRDVFKNGWYHTGDLLKKDELGNYFFVDRKCDLIRYKGRSVSSLAVESVANQHPKIQSTAAFGIESKELSSEHEIMLAVVLKLGSSMQENELAQFISENAPYYFVPRYIEFLSELPMTPTNKIQKNSLRIRGITKNTWDSMSQE